MNDKLKNAKLLLTDIDPGRFEELPTAACWLQKSNFKSHYRRLLLSFISPFRWRLSSTTVVVLTLGTIVPSVSQPSTTGCGQATETVMAWEGWVPVDSIDLS